MINRLHLKLKTFLTKISYSFGTNKKILIPGMFFLLGGVVTASIGNFTDRFYSQILSEGQIITLNSCSSIIEFERNYVVPGTNKIIQGNAKIPNSAYVAVSNNGTEIVENMRFSTYLREPNDRRATTTLLSSNVYVSGKGIAERITKPTISLGDSSLDFTVEYMNPGETILIHFYVDGPTIIDSEVSGKGITVVKTNEPGCEDSKKIKEADTEAKFGTSMNFFNEELCTVENGSLSCELTGQSDTFKVGPGMDIGRDNLPVPYIHSFEADPDPLLE